MLACGGTVLGNLAAQLAPGTWAELTTSGLTSSFLLDPAGNGHDILEYSDDALWNPVAKEFWYTGAGHVGAGKFIRYQDATNAWGQLSSPSTFSGIHSYDHNAIDPVRGIHYKRHAGTYSFYRYSLSTDSWSSLPSITGVSGPSVAGALEYFPDRDSLIYVESAYGAPGSYGRVFEYRFASASWSQLADGLTMGPYHNFAAYSPIHKVMIVGGGNGSAEIYRLNAGGVIAKMSNAPLDLGINNTVITIDPLAGNFLVLGPDKSFRSYNPITDTWAVLNKIGQTPPNFWDASGGSAAFRIVATPVSTYGVTMFLAWNNGSPKVYLYKHSAGTPASDSTPPGAPTGLRVN